MDNAESTITFCMDEPIKVNKTEWMFGHIGRASVGIDRGDHYEILAYSDQESDRPELSRMAKREKARYIKSVESEGVMVVE